MRGWVVKAAVQFALAFKLYLSSSLVSYIARPIFEGFGAGKGVLF